MKTKHIVLTVLIGILLFIAVPGHARMFCNGGEIAFASVGGTFGAEGAALTSDSIAELIIKGAEFYFLANADINHLSEKIEISDIYGVDSFTMCKRVNSAPENMKMARYNYRLLECKANVGSRESSCQ